MKIITAADVRPDILAYLDGWFAKAKARQEAKGVKFNLTFGDFLNLWGTRRLRSLEKWMDDGSLYVRQRRSTKDDPNLTGYVLTWTNYAASQGSEMNEGNARISTRGESFATCRMGKGDKHSDNARGKISAATKGIPKSDEHKQKISKAMQGIERGPMDDAGRLARSVAAKAHWDRKRAEKEAQKGTDPRG